MSFRYWLNAGYLTKTTKTIKSQKISSLTEDLMFEFDKRVGEIYFNQVEKILIVLFSLVTYCLTWISTLSIC